ncbi:glycosyl transferase family 2 [Kocuria flava]|uniref:Dolichol monophosphate mannose synthase n=1 Tax=Kocuria flava TaxID=446860 RepID=A0A0U2XN16_9MICC|nr:glycosyltransferase [Kocuria flava]ALU39650.1 glycosyl transferase family 2 [Kocuria flava]GEO91729.1 dolichol monophosphate mannose synthase [Kocuria flava]
MELTVIVPTFNETPNVPELVRRAAQALHGVEAEILFVDDSTDRTPEVIEATAAGAPLPVRLLHRTAPTGGLGGAVICGIRASTAAHCIVMDGDLQHPPDMLPVLLSRLREGVADVVVASRYCGAGGSAGGLANGTRRAVSCGATLLARGLFPRRLRSCTDPMTGFFGFRRAAVHTDRLRPSGFKILLEILGRHRLDVAEVPFVFGQRLAGDSKAGWREGGRFLRQLAVLRFGRLAGFGLVGAIGTVLNLLIMGVLVGLGAHYLVAAVVAAEVTIVTNFLMQERMVFHRTRSAAGPLQRRFLRSFVFNNADAALRLPLLWGLVEVLGANSVAAQAATLAGAFVVRYLYHSRVVYREVRPAAAAARPAAPGPAVAPGGTSLQERAS